MTAVDLFVGLTDRQQAVCVSSHRVECEWFGGSIPLKKTIQDAIEAHEEHMIRQQGIAEKPHFVMCLSIQADKFMHLVHTDVLEVCPWVKGYRLKRDFVADAGWIADILEVTQAA